MSHKRLHIEKYKPYVKSRKNTAMGFLCVYNHDFKL